jgi:2-phospho-L-lactate guanylyltransferase
MVSDIPALDRRLGIDAVEHFDTRRARGLNEDLTTAAGWAGAQGATHVLIVHADLPRLTPQAIDRFVAGAGKMPAARMRAAACKQGSGTNLLLAPVPLSLPLVFGKNSLSRFCRMAAAADLPIDVIHDAVLAADIDEPDDFRALLLAHAHGELAGRATADFLLAAMAARAQPGTSLQQRTLPLLTSLLCHAAR